jgi:hypothetical protein
MDRYPTETGWLVEMNDGGLHYYSFAARVSDENALFGGWVRDVNEATRFARKQDAVALIEAVGWNSPHVYAAEHCWGGEKVRSTV